MNSQKMSPETSEKFSFKEAILNFRSWYFYLLSRWKVLVTISLIGGLIGYFFAFFSKPTYIAITTFVLEDSNTSSPLGQYAGLASMVGIDVGSGGGIFKGDNILELYKSRKMIEKTLFTISDVDGSKDLLINRYIKFNELEDKWKEELKLANILFKIPPEDSAYTLNRQQDSLVSLIVRDINKKYLKVSKPDAKLSIIQAEVKAIDETFAKEFNEQIVKNVNDFYIQTKIRRSSENVEILTSKTDSVRALMNASIYSAAKIADATPNLNLTRQVQRIAPVQKSQFNSEANKLLLSEMVKNLELSKLSLLKETPLIQVIDEPRFPLEKSHKGKIKYALLFAIVCGIVTGIFLIVKKVLNSLLD